MYFFYFLGHAYNVHDRCLCAGYDNGDIKLFDLRNMSLRWETNVKNGVSAPKNTVLKLEYLLLAFAARIARVNS